MDILIVVAIFVAFGYLILVRVVKRNPHAKEVISEFSPANLLSSQTKSSMGGAQRIWNKEQHIM